MARALANAHVIVGLLLVIFGIGEYVAGASTGYIYFGIWVGVWVSSARGLSNINIKKWSVLISMFEGNTVTNYVDIWYITTMSNVCVGIVFRRGIGCILNLFHSYREFKPVCKIEHEWRQKENCLIGLHSYTTATSRQGYEKGKVFTLILYQFEPTQHNAALWEHNYMTVTIQGSQNKINLLFSLLAMMLCRWPVSTRRERRQVKGFYFEFNFR